MLRRERIDGPTPTRLFDPGPMQLTTETALWCLDDRIDRGQLVEIYSTESGLRLGYWLGVQRSFINGLDIVITETSNASPSCALHVAPCNVREVTVLQGPRPALWEDDFDAIEEAAAIAIDEASPLAA